MNAFCHDLSRPPTLALKAHLALLCSQPGHSRGFPVQQMERLEALGLVCRSSNKWQPTWLGHGVNNWHRQMEARLYLDCEASLPEPRPGENGRDPGPPCNHFRELLFRRGFCWCARPADLHPGSPRQDQPPRRDPEAQGSGQSLIRLLRDTTSTERFILQQIAEHQGSGVEPAELAGRTAFLVDPLALKTGVERLTHRNLVQCCPPYLLTWDGRGLVHYMAELAVAREKGLPLSEPGRGENGVDRAVRACAEFRATLTEPASCWCGWELSSHG